MIRAIANRHGRLSPAVLDVLLFGAAWVWSLPWPLLNTHSGLDSSWIVGINWALARGLQFGRDIVFTYGPLGFLDPPFLVEYQLWRVSFLFRLFAHTLLFVSSYLTARHAVSDQGPWARLLYSLPMVSVLAFRPDVSQPGKEVVFSVMLLFLVYSTRKELFSRRFAVLMLTVLSFLLAIASLIKFNYAIDAVLLLAALGLVSGFRPNSQLKTWLMVGTAYVVTVPFLWVVAGQNLLNFGAFVWGGIQVSIGYSSAMAIGNGLFSQAVLGFGSLVLFLGILVYYLARRSYQIVALLVLNSGLLFESFKHGFVRYDFGHVLSFYTYVGPLLAITSILTLADLQRDIRRIRHIIPVLAPISLVVMVGVLPILAPPATAIAAMGRDNVTKKVTEYRQAISLFLNPQAGQSSLDAIKGTVRAEYSIHPRLVQRIGNSRVDIFPWDIALLWAYNMNWTPRPMFQTYNDYTSGLDHLNSVYLSGPRAPEYILFGYKEDIDGRYLLFDEPETFRTLLCMYRYVDSDANFALLRHTKTETCGSPQEVVAVVASMGEFVPVPQPANALLFARVLVKYSMQGSIAGFLYKPSSVYVTFQFANGKNSQRFRFIVDTAKNGVFVSTYVVGLPRLVELFQGHVSGDIRNMMLTSDDPSQYVSELIIEYFSIPQT